MSLIQLFIEFGYVVVPLSLEEVSSHWVSKVVLSYHVLGFRVVAALACHPQLSQSGGDPSTGLLVDCTRMGKLKESFVCNHSLLTEKDVAMQSSVFRRSSTNVLPPLLTLSEVGPRDIEHHPVSPLPPLWVTSTRGIRIWRSCKSYDVIGRGLPVIMRVYRAESSACQVTTGAFWTCMRHNTRHWRACGMFLSDLCRSEHDPRLHANPTIVLDLKKEEK